MQGCETWLWMNEKSYGNIPLIEVIEKTLEFKLGDSGEADWIGSWTSREYVWLPVQEMALYLEKPIFDLGYSTSKYQILNTIFSYWEHSQVILNEIAWVTYSCCPSFKFWHCQRCFQLDWGAEGRCSSWHRWCTREWAQVFEWGKVELMWGRTRAWNTTRDIHAEHGLERKGSRSYGLILFLG